MSNIKTPVDLLKELLVGKKIKHKNQHSREVVLEVENVESQHHHRQITPDTPQNDWWGDSCSWNDIKITFVDGSKINIELTTKLEIV